MVVVASVVVVKPIFEYLEERTRTRTHNPNPQADTRMWSRAGCYANFLFVVASVGGDSD